MLYGGRGIGGDDVILGGPGSVFQGQWLPLHVLETRVKAGAAHEFSFVSDGLFGVYRLNTPYRTEWEPLIPPPVLASER